MTYNRIAYELQRFWDRTENDRYRTAIMLLEELGYAPLYIGTGGVVHVLGSRTAYKYLEELGYVYSRKNRTWTTHR